MRSILRITLILLAVSIFSSCRKNIDRPSQPYINPLQGSWVISATEANDGYGWQPYSTGYEHGTFDFYDHSVVQYSDSYGTLTGSWYINTSQGGFYDEHGNFYTGVHESLQLHMTDSETGSPSDIYFSYINFINNDLMVATYSDGRNVYRITFSRY